MNNQIDVNNEPDIITLSPIKQSPTIESSGKEQTTRKIQQKFHSPLFSPKNYSTLDSPNNLYCVLKKLNYYSPSNNSSEMVSKLESGHLSEDKQNMTLPKNSHHPTESNMTHYYECNSPAHHKQVSFMTDVDDFHSCGSEEDDHDEKHDQNQKNAPGNPNSFLSPSQRAMMNHRIQSSGVDSYLNATGEGISPYQFRVEKNSTTVTPGTHDKRSSLRPTFHTPGPVSFTSFGVAGGEGSQIPDLDALNSDSVNISCDEKNKRHVRGIGNSSGSQAEDYRDVNRDAEYERQLSQVRKEKTTRSNLGIFPVHHRFQDPDVVDITDLDSVKQQALETLHAQDIKTIIKNHLRSRGKLKRNFHDYYQQKKVSKLNRSSTNRQQYKQHQTSNIISMLSMKQNGALTSGNPSSNKAELTNQTIPNHPQAHLAQYSHNVFCGQFSDQGSYYFTTCQDSLIRLYDMEQIEDYLYSSKTPQPEPIKEIASIDMGWAVVDCHCSRQEDAIIYSSWSPYIHLTSTSPEDTVNHSLDMEPASSHFCPFSLRFSHSGQEVLAGCSDNSLYLYDLEAHRRTLKINAHKNDINSVCFADETSDLFVSGSDDGLCKVWDRRTLRDNRPVGVFMGHIEGITCVAALGDGRYFATNSKDQTMKLWDLRTMGNADIEHAKPKSHPSWDYRWQECPTDLPKKQHKHDMSVFTFRGHSILRTLIRCYFSPRETTGQRYLYTGSSDGSVFIYDILTGELADQLEFHDQIVRDVSWHPYYPLIATASWDQLVTLWGPNEIDGPLRDVKVSTSPSRLFSAMY